MQASQSTPHTPLLFVLLLLCIWGAAKDRTYKKAGGIRPDRFEKRLLLGTIAVCILLLVVIGLRSFLAAVDLTPGLAVAIFGCWEIHRWLIRRKNPVGRALK